MKSLIPRYFPLVVILALTALACQPAAPQPAAPTAAPAQQPAPPKPEAKPQTKPEAKAPAEAPKPEAQPKPKPQRDLAAYFDGKEIKIIVGSSPGGGYDTFGRLFARFVPNHLPGNPRFTVENIPGAGHQRGLETAMRAKPDGLTLFVLHPRFILREITGQDVPSFDPDTVSVIGSPTGAARTPRMWCARREVATSWEEVVQLGRALKNGGTGPGGSFGLGPAFAQAIGAPVEMVYGYGGTSEIMAAFDRGELDSTDRCTDDNVPRLFPEWIERKVLAPIFWWEAQPTQDWLKQIGAEMPPYILDVVNATDVQKETFESTIELASMERTFVMPPGVPSDVHQAWKQAFEATMRDPGFVQAARDAGYEPGSATADQFRTVVERGKRLPEEGKKLLGGLVGE